ncbi:MAG: hypothetical protein JNL21_09470 [Myxococcales bacterium]|nr:hypothetical protein [Myxococcales bacterium]
MRAALGLVALLSTACNLVFGLEEATEAAAGGGGAGGAQTSSTGSVSEGGAGGGACPPEESAGPGTELLANGSFEEGVFGWLASGLGSLEPETTGRFCGCQSARVVMGAGYAELRSVLPGAGAGTYHARARMKAPDLVEADLLVRVDDVELTAPVPFAIDAADAEGADGWRTAEATWPSAGGTTALFAISFDGTSAPQGTEVLVDCVSLTLEP